MSSIRYMAAAVAAVLWATSAGAKAPIDHVDNFALLDQAGKYHDLYYLSDAKAVVLMTHDDECAAVNDALPALEQAKASYGARGVEFLMINPQDDRDAVAAKVKGSSIPVLIDETQCWSSTRRAGRSRIAARSTGPTTTKWPVLRSSPAHSTPCWRASR
jgi:hypothetical protein